MGMKRIVVAIAIVIVSQGSYAQTKATSKWAAASAGVTVAEFIDAYFYLHLHRHETSDAFNSFNLVSFYPSSSQESAIVVVIQTYNDGGKSTDDPRVRQEIRVVADGTVNEFVASFGLHVLKTRWSPEKPKSAIVVKHVRVNDLQDTLAVTVDGVTSFDPADFKAAERRVRTAGGVWMW